MIETKILLTEQEDKLLVEFSKENMQSKTKFCTMVVRNYIMALKAKERGQKIKQKDY